MGAKWSKLIPKKKKNVNKFIHRERRSGTNRRKIDLGKPVGPQRRSDDRRSRGIKLQGR